MIIDFSELENGQVIDTDICIVGAGAAGITIAKEFIGTRYKVLVLESGGFEREAQTQELYDSEVVGLPHVSIHDGRIRILGGTTTLWGGQALRFDAFDMQHRSWVPQSGWPITPEVLGPYYKRAEQVLQLGPRISYGELCSTFRVEPPAFDPAKLYMECSQWSPKPSIGATYRDQLKLAQNLTVLLHANVTSIVTNGTATLVEKIEFTTLTGKKGTAKARFYVVCCGGIETARLLLVSDRIQKQGLGNDHDLVGRYFQEHIHIRFGDLVPVSRELLQNVFESFYVRGLKYFPLIALTKKIQVEKQLLSIHGSAIFDDDPDSGVTALKQLFRILVRKGGATRDEVRRFAGNALTNPADLFRIGYRFYVKRRSGSPSQGSVYLGAQAEVAPNPQSRVLLSDSVDRLGMRKAILDWRLSDLERRTLSEYIRIVAGEFRRIGLGSFDLKQAQILEDPLRWVYLAHDSAHHMGTVRMHNTPQFGVVDPNCQVYRVENLYIGSSAVFPTSARSNPTLTILALCLRIADRLKDLMNRAKA